MSVVVPLKGVAYRQLRTANQGQSSQALIVQAHCKSVLIQPSVDLSKHANLKVYAKNVNDALDKAKTNSNTYLNTILPGMIATVSDMGAYFSLQSVIANTFTPSSTPADTLRKLKIAQERVTTYKSNATTTLTQLQKFREGLSTDASNFARVVENMNTAVKGNNGALAELNKSIDDVDKKIKGSIAGIALSGLAIVGGAFVILVGAVGSFVTAGTSAPAVVVGIGIVVTGAAGLVASSVALSKLIGAKTNLIQLRAGLEEEVRLATSLHSTYKGLAETAVDAVQATQDMANAWTSMGQSLGGLIKNLEAGADVHTDKDMLEFYGLLAADDLTTIKNDIGVIKLQLSGVKTSEVIGQNPSSLIISELHLAA